MHGRGRMTIDPRILGILGRGTSGFHRPGGGGGGGVSGTFVRGGGEVNIVLWVLVLMYLFAEEGVIMVLSAVLCLRERGCLRCWYSSGGRGGARRGKDTFGSRSERVRKIVL